MASSTNENPAAAVTAPAPAPAATATAATANSTPAAKAPQQQQQQQQPQQNLPTAVEFEPPLACVRRILKTTLPASTNVGKDASAAFARSAGIFIIYLTACANDFARENRRQTITANDVLAACKELDFEEFTPKLEEFLESYRANEKRKKDAKAKAASAKAMDEPTKTATPQSTAGAESPTTVNPPGGDESHRQEKDDESTEEEATEEEDNDNTAREDEDDEADNTTGESPNKKQKLDDSEE